MAIRITGLCQRLNCLPGPGGLLDQDSYLVYCMELVLAAASEREEMDRRKKKHGP